MSCSGSHLGITINIKNTKFVKDLPMIDAQFRFNQCNSFREEDISVFSSINTGPYRGKYRNIFFSEAIALIEPKLCINHWKVLYKLCVFYVDRNSKMTTST
jgi:hypothetical protein